MLRLFVLPQRFGPWASRRGGVCKTSNARFDSATGLHMPTPNEGKSKSDYIARCVRGHGRRQGSGTSARPVLRYVARASWRLGISTSSTRGWPTIRPIMSANRVFTVTISEYPQCSAHIDADMVQRALWASMAFCDCTKSK